MLQHYQGIATNPSMEIYIVTAAYALMKLIQKRFIVVRPMLPLVAYAVYVSVAHGFAVVTLFREMLQVVIFLAVFNRCIDVKRLLQYCTKIAVAATALLLLQYVFFYLLHTHLQLVPDGLLLDSAEQWVQLVRTGLVGVSGKSTGFYRPSAIFLEPSHFALFCIPVVLINLLHLHADRRSVKTAAFVSLGILLSTSGMGIVAVVLIWGLYLVFFYKNRRPGKSFRFSSLFTSHALAIVLVFLVALVALYFTVPFFRKSVERILLSSPDENTALGARTSTGIRSLGMLTGIHFWLGFGDTVSVKDWNMSGFFLTMFMHGLIGMVLFYMFYIKSLFVMKREAFWVIFLFVGLSFVTVHMFAAYYRIYYTFIVLQGYLERGPREEKTARPVLLTRYPA